tara:strand:+ start:2604 stop:3263 length:660 start_codon:yes stop_codon:yes gene_type:complete
MNAIEFDVTSQLNTFNKLADSMGFIVSKAINDLAYEKGRKSLSIHLSDKLNIKNKVVARTAAIKVDKSNKKNLKVGLFYQLGKNPNSNINKWMGLQQYGGTETAGGGKLAIPLRDNFARYAGVPRTKSIPKSLKISTIMDKAPSTRDKSKVYNVRGIKPVIGKKGVWARTSQGFKLLYVFKSKAEHNKKLINFQFATEKTFNANLERYINRQYLRVLKS